MNTLATAYPIHGRPKTAKINYINSGCLKRLRHFIENSDWDDRIIGWERRTNKICIWFIIASTLYLVPILIKAIASVF